MNMTDVLRSGLVGKKLVSVGKSQFKNANILDVESVTGWEMENDWSTACGVTMMLSIEYDHGKQRRKKAVKIYLDDEFVIES